MGSLLSWEPHIPCLEGLCSVQCVQMTRLAEAGGVSQTPGQGPLCPLLREQGDLVPGMASWGRGQRRQTWVLCVHPSRGLHAPRPTSLQVGSCPASIPLRRGLWQGG